MTDNTEAVKKLAEIIQVLDGDEPEYHQEGMGCGLEDRNITDRYEAMEYGWEAAMERIYNEVINYAKDELTAIQADPLAYVKPKPLEWVEHKNPYNDYAFLRANTSMGWYEIHGNVWSFNAGDSGVCFNQEAAQTAANENYCNRVKELF